MADKPFIALCLHLVLSTLWVAILIKFSPNFALYLSSAAHLILYALISFVTYGLTKRLVCTGRINPHNKAVIITGCDTGFGHALAKSLDAKGFKVFASCLFPNGPGALQLKNSCSSNVHVLGLDVREDESVEKAVDFVKQNLGNSELWALVNNAGIWKGTFVEFTSTEDFREVLEVNVMGPVRVTKAFLPLIRKSTGRIVNVTSFAARVPIFASCAYTTSKYAALAFTECLNLEMKMWGIPVISIEPELYSTEMLSPKAAESALDNEFMKVSNTILNVYDEEFMKILKNGFITTSKSTSPNIHDVIGDIESAIMDVYPNFAYKPRRNIFTRTIAYLVEALPYEFQQYVFFEISAYIYGVPITRYLKKKL